MAVLQKRKEIILKRRTAETEATDSCSLLVWTDVRCALFDANDGVCCLLANMC